MKPEQAKALREPFPKEQIGKLPRVTCKDCSDRNARCTQHKKQKCDVCKAFISTAHIHLDFVGHAAATSRLLEVDPEWTWEPFAIAPDGGPLIRKEGTNATLWIRLTVAGVSRYGVGIAATNSIELEKQLISDAIRNAAMRFGVALDLWAKEDLHAEVEDSPSASRTKDARPSAPAGNGDQGTATVERPPGGGSHPTPDLPPCNEDALKASIREMNQPALANALRKRKIDPEGSVNHWRKQLYEAMSAEVSA